MNKIPEQQKYRTEVVEQNLKVMLAEKQIKTELVSVQKYRIYIHRRRCPHNWYTNLGSRISQGNIYQVNFSKNITLYSLLNKQIKIKN